MRVKCDTAAECATPCGHALPHQATREFTRTGFDCAERHSCPGGYGIVRCNPVEEQVECNQKDACHYKGCIHVGEHECAGGLSCRINPCINEGGVRGATCQPLPLGSPSREYAQATPTAACNRSRASHDAGVAPRGAVPTDLTSPLRPLKNVQFSSKAVELLDMIEKFTPEEWDKLWEMVKGTTWAQEQMAHEKAERDTMTKAVFESSVRTIILQESGAHSRRGQHMQLADHATARIAKLPPVRD